MVFLSYPGLCNTRDWYTHKKETVHLQYILERLGSNEMNLYGNLTDWEGAMVLILDAHVQMTV